MTKSGKCGAGFLKRSCRGCRRHLVVWLVVLLCVYSIFYISQYITIDSDHGNSEHNSGPANQHLFHHKVIPTVSDVVKPVLPTWGNMTGLKGHIKPILVKYSKAMKQKGAKTELRLPWDTPEVDYRRKACRNPPRVNTSVKATIIVTLQGARIDKALTSLFSIIKLTNINLIEDVIIIGDIGLPSLYRDIYEIFPDYLPTFRIFYSPKRTTITHARKYAAKFAHGDILVFLDGLVSVTSHWLDYLMAAILKNPHSIIQPIIIKNDTVLDDFGQPMFYQKKELQLDMTLKEFKFPIFPNQFVDSVQKESVVSSSAFALTKELYGDLRELDEFSGFSDLEMIVVSLKAWMCGGGVLLAPCSIVLHQSSPLANQSSLAITPLVSKTMEAKRKRHLQFVSSVWFPPYDDVYKCLLPKSTQIRLSYTEKRVIKLARTFYSRLNCKKFTEFVKLVQPNLTKPKPNTTRYGNLKLQGHDLYLSRLGHGFNLTFVSDLASLSYPFNFVNSSLSVKNMCVTYVPNTSVKLTLCQARNANQKWLYTNGQLQLKRNPHMCIVKQTNIDRPTINLCRNVNVLSVFNFTLHFDVNCIK